MQLDPFKPQEAREIAQRCDWTTQSLLDKLPNVPPWWIRDAIAQSFNGELSELIDNIIELRNQQAAAGPAVYLGLVLFFLGHPVGGNVFLKNLRDDDPKLRMMVLDSFRSLKQGDIGYAGSPGTLAVSAEEIYASIRDLLQEPNSKAGSIALDFALNDPVFAISRSDTQPLLAHNDPEVRDKVLRAYLSRGFDDGALNALAAQLLDPSDPFHPPESAWWNQIWNNCYPLLDCAHFSTDEKVRARAGVLALQILKEAIKSRDPRRREKLNFIPLMKTICLTRVSNAAKVFETIIDAEHVPILIRAHSLLSYFDLEGLTHPNTHAIVQRLIQETAPRYSDTILNELAWRGLIGTELLTLASREPQWSEKALPILQAMPIDENQVMQNTITALGVFVSKMEDDDAIPGTLLESMYKLPRSERDNEAIIGHLHVALKKSSRVIDRPWLAQKVMHHLVLFGDLSLLQSNRLAPWDITNATWRLNNWTYSQIIDLLTQAHIVTPTELHGKSEFQQRYADEEPINFLINAFTDQIVVESIRDICRDYQHHILFGRLAANVRPPLVIEALSETTEQRMERSDSKLYDNSKHEQTAANIGGIPVYSTEGTSCLVRFIYNNRVHNFVAYPSGTWMDVWSVIHAFNLFMKSIDREERAYWLEEPGDWDDFHVFICAHKTKFAEINKQLRLPIRIEKV